MRYRHERWLILASVIGALVVADASQIRAGPLDNTARVGATYADDAWRAFQRSPGFAAWWRRLWPWGSSIGPQELVAVTSACSYYTFKDELADSFEVEFLKETVAFLGELEKQIPSGRLDASVRAAIKKEEDKLNEEIQSQAEEPSLKQTAQRYGLWLFKNGYNLYNLRECAKVLASL